MIRNGTVLRFYRACLFINTVKGTTRFDPGDLDKCFSAIKDEQILLEFKSSNTSVIVSYLKRITDVVKNKSPRMKFFCNKALRYINYGKHEDHSGHYTEHSDYTNMSAPIHRDEIARHSSDCHDDASYHYDYKTYHRNHVDSGKREWVPHDDRPNTIEEFQQFKPYFEKKN